MAFRIQQFLYGTDSIRKRLDVEMPSQGGSWATIAARPDGGEKPAVALLSRRVVVLRGSGVVLRPANDDDVFQVWQAVVESVGQISPWQQWCHPGYEPEEAAKYIRFSGEARTRRDSFEFLITDASSDVVLGGCGLNQIDWINRRANLGYWVRSSATGRGIATAAARLLARHGFEELGLLRVEVVVAVGNVASERVAAKLGATREGRLRNRLLLGGHPRDAFGFSLTPADL
jgi:ribosomal-protein-serine acetyltransferase